MLLVMCLVAVMIHAATSFTEQQMTIAFVAVLGLMAAPIAKDWYLGEGSFSESDAKEEGGR